MGVKNILKNRADLQGRGSPPPRKNRLVSYYFVCGGFCFFKSYLPQNERNGLAEKNVKFKRKRESNREFYIKMLTDLSPPPRSLGCKVLLKLNFYASLFLGWCENNVVLGFLSGFLL